MKYRKKPVVVEACQTDREVVIHTLEGDMKASSGDYIITGVNGEQYPCKPNIFAKTYEPVTNTNFDRIKAMSVEEMADFIVNDRKRVIYSMATGCEVKLINGLREFAYENIKEWLESEVQEDE